MRTTTSKLTTKDLDAAGLPASSVVRMKLFTLDNQLVLRKAGVLGEKDQRCVAGAMRQLLSVDITTTDNFP